MIITLPTTSGYMVEWETNKAWTDKRGKIHKMHDSYETTDYQKALAKKAELEKAGFKDVQMYECIF